MKGLWQLTWLEIKIFAREPLGLFGTIAIPVVVFLVLGRLMRGAAGTPASPEAMFLKTGLPVLAAILMSISAVVSLVTIIAIYRESGILKRLRAKPLRSHTILTAHVLVKLLLTAATLGLTVLAGARRYPVAFDARLLGFVVALSISTVSLLSIGFLIASIVPTARLAQPIGSVLLYPMLGFCGLFTPIAALPPGAQSVAHVVPLTYAVSLLRGAWLGEPWSSHIGDIAALVIVFAICTAASARVFRWE